MTQFFEWSKSQNRTVECSECAQKVIASLEWFVPTTVSFDALASQLKNKLQPIYCMDCSCSIQKCCGLKLESSTTDSDLDEWDLELEQEQNLYHCPDSQFYILSHFFLLLELVFQDDKALTNSRTQSAKAIMNSVGYAGGDIRLDLKVNGQNEVATKNTDFLIMRILEEICQFLPDTERCANTADLVPHQGLVDLLRSSVLGPLLKRYLKNASVLELSDVAKTLFSVCEILSNHETTVDFLYQPLISESQLLAIANGQSIQQDMTFQESFYELLCDLNTQIKFLQNEELAKNTRIMDLYQLLSKNAPKSTVLKRKRTGFDTTVTKYPYDVELSQPPNHVLQEFISELKRLSFKQAAMKNDNVYMHCLSGNVADSPKRSKAISKDLAILSTSMPVHYSTFAAAVVAEERMDLVKLCISGPEGTPYANGLYFFDICFPDNYPFSPPKFQYLTTGNGLWRANPNLYQNGKVCLSLLNTWSHNQWIPGKSTLLQVIISIQSMIFVPRPYFNEPGYGDPQDHAKSIDYNAAIRKNVVHFAMLDILQNPPLLFADVVKAHFMLKKARIYTQLNAWQEFQPLPHKAALETFLQQYE